jgi:hypothetical protein
MKNVEVRSKAFPRTTENEMSEAEFKSDRQGEPQCHLVFLCRSQALESIVAYALLRAAPTLVSSLGAPLLGYLFAGEASHSKHKSLIMFVFTKLNGIGLERPLHVRGNCEVIRRSCLKIHLRESTGVGSAGKK